jgi:hypothetical protein
MAIFFFSKSFHYPIKLSSQMKCIIKIWEMLKPLFDKHNAIPDDNSKTHHITHKSIKKSLITGVLAEIDDIAMYELL